ncbi:hypothetical protein [uncultured Kordia sp.]|uniref:hypothetical protein n=1 Tax=uncultured Kordia sp. TaxID=507699 RepID=UPI002616C29E|nr:hypothetical protein [uncultured Kordia sp.]
MGEKTITKEKLWRFVNTSFGIWLLSSVMVGFFTFSYAKLSESISSRKNKKKQILMLDQEIEGRIYQLISKQERRRDSIDVSDEVIEQSSRNRITKDVWFDFKATPVGNYEGLYNMYPEFSERNIVSLMVELISLIDDDDEVEKIKKVIYKIISDKILPLNVRNEKDYEDFISKVNSELRLERWQKFWPKQ